MPARRTGGVQPVLRRLSPDMTWPGAALTRPPATASACRR